MADLRSENDRWQYSRGDFSGAIPGGQSSDLSRLLEVKREDILKIRAERLGSIANTGRIRQPRAARFSRLLHLFTGLNKTS